MTTELRMLRALSGDDATLLSLVSDAEKLCAAGERRMAEDREADARAMAVVIAARISNH